MTRWTRLGRPAPAGDLTERQLQAAVRQALEARGWRVAVTWTSIHSPRGWPDLFAVRGRQFAAIELKSARGRVTPEQQGWLTALAELPGAAYVGVVRPADWYAGVLDGLLDAPAQTRCVHDHYVLRLEHYVRIDQPEHEH